MSGFLYLSFRYQNSCLRCIYSVAWAKYHYFRILHQYPSLHRRPRSAQGYSTFPSYAHANTGTQISRCNHEDSSFCADSSRYVPCTLWPLSAAGVSGDLRIAATSLAFYLRQLVWSDCWPLQDSISLMILFCWWFEEAEVGCGFCCIESEGVGRSLSMVIWEVVCFMKTLPFVDRDEHLALYTFKWIAYSSNFDSLSSGYTNVRLDLLAVDKVINPRLSIDTLYNVLGFWVRGHLISLYLLQLCEHVSVPNHWLESVRHL